MKYMRAGRGIMQTSTHLPYPHNLWRQTLLCVYINTRLTCMLYTHQTADFLSYARCCLREHSPAIAAVLRSTFPAGERAEVGGATGCWIRCLPTFFWVPSRAINKPRDALRKTHDESHPQVAPQLFSIDRMSLRDSLPVYSTAIEFAKKQKYVLIRLCTRVRRGTYFPRFRLAASMCSCRQRDECEGSMGDISDQRKNLLEAIIVSCCQSCV